MSFDEALAILGIDRSVGKKGARRAYLKLIKVHKPDRDPVMFRRIREAYECVKDDIEIYAQFYTPPPEPAPPEPVAPSEPVTPPAFKPAAPAPERADVLFERILQGSVADALRERAPVDPPRIDPVVDDAPRIKILDPVDDPPVDDPPVDPPKVDAYRSLAAEIETLDPPRIDPLDAEPPRVDVLDNPLRVQTHAERPIRIEARSNPPSEPPPVIPYRAPAQAFNRGPSPADLMRRAWAVFNDGGTAQKVERLTQQAFAAAHTDPEADQPPPADAINLCLALFTNGRIVPARRVTRAMRTWLSETGLERTVMGGKLAASLAVLQALVGLPADSPAYPVARIARATRDDALESAQPPLRDFARETPFSALTSANHFRDHAPLLDGLYGELLRAGSAVELNNMTAQVPARRGRGCLWLGAVMLALFALGTLVSTCERSGQSSYKTPPRIIVPKIKIPPFKMPKIEMPKIEIPALDDSQFLSPPKSGPESEMSSADTRRVLDFTTPPSDKSPVWVRVICRPGDDFQASACVTVKGLERALSTPQCPSAQQHLRVLEQTVMRSTAQRGAIILARQQYERACSKR